MAGVCSGDEFDCRCVDRTARAVGGASAGSDAGRRIGSAGCCCLPESSACCRHRIARGQRQVIAVQARRSNSEGRTWRDVMRCDARRGEAARSSGHAALLPLSAKLWFDVDARVVGRIAHSLARSSNRCVQSVSYRAHEHLCHSRPAAPLLFFFFCFCLSRESAAAAEKAHAASSSRRQTGTTVRMKTQGKRDSKRVGRGPTNSTTTGG